FAWLQVLAAFFCLMNSWGIVNTFGVFQSYFMTSSIGNASSIAWIGSTQAFLILAVAPICGALFDAGHCRHMVFGGTILIALSTFSATLSGGVNVPGFALLMVTQGVVTGVGLGLLFTPAIALVSTYFTKNRALAVGIGTSGAGFGGVVYPIIMRALLNRLGYIWSMRVMSFTVVITQCVPLILIDQRHDLPLRPLGSNIIGISSLRSLKFILFSLGVFIVFLGLLTPYFFLPAWAVSENINIPFENYYLLSIMNAGGLLGRIIPALLADHFSSPMTTHAACTFISGVLIMCWILTKSSTGVTIFCVFYGYFSGAFLALTPTCVAGFGGYINTLGARMGVVFFVSGLGSFIGGPVIGRILVAAGWATARAAAGACVLVGAGVVGVVAARGK
ncbi:MFS general substrate transporter, partial [Wilcoxina mikolae CBS 423.85]